MLNYIWMCIHFVEDADVEEDSDQYTSYQSGGEIMYTVNWFKICQILWWKWYESDPKIWKASEGKIFWCPNEGHVLSNVKMENPYFFVCVWKNKISILALYLSGFHFCAKTPLNIVSQIHVYVMHI